MIQSKIIEDCCGIRTMDHLNNTKLQLCSVAGMTNISSIT